ncbi:SulP family inorganic anion transporter [Actimicrobium antarcticum]
MNDAPRMSWRDLIAGMSLAGLLLPEAVAYAGMANLPPQAGVVAMFAGLVCYGLIGTSRFAIVSATSSSAAVLAAATTAAAGGNPTLQLAFGAGLVLLTGVFFLAAGMARIGSVSDFIAKPVLRGFAFGLAIVIIVKQFAAMAGVAPRHTDMIRYLGELGSLAASWNWASVLVGMVALALLFLCARIPRLPGGLLVILIGIAAGRWLPLAQQGISLVGSLTLDLPAPALPQLSYAGWLRMAELGMAMVLILYAESTSSIRTFAMQHGDRVVPNRDLLALGAANLVSGLCQGMPAGAGYSATSANEASGAVSRLAGGIAALTLLLIVLACLPAIALIPQPVLAAIVIHAVSHTLRPSVFQPYFRLHRDRFVILAAVLAVLLLGVVDGLLAAVAVSLLMLLRRLSESSVTVLGRLDHGHDFVSTILHPAAQPVPGILIVRPDTALFFANAERILTQARHALAASGKQTRTLILSLEASPDLDSSTVEAIGDFHRALRNQQTHLLFARLKNPAREVLLRAAIDGLNEVTLCDLSVDDAVNAALTLQPLTGNDAAR